MYFLTLYNRTFNVPRRCAENRSYRRLDLKVINFSCCSEWMTIMLSYPIRKRHSGDLNLRGNIFYVRVCV